jgi:mannose-1-phosphate guanylyltransferase
MNIVIMAGGGGTRLWPLSRRDNPKQFLDLGSGQTLIEHTYKRAKALAETSDIFVATSERYLDRIKKLLPAVPADNIFLEPDKRDTAAAFAAAAVQLQMRQRADAPTIFMWSDHVFTDEEEFVGDLKKIPGLVTDHPETIVILGHAATFPETGFGYIEAGEPLEGAEDIFKVKAFKEKPDKETAAGYVAAGSFFWNMGYLSARPAYILEQLRIFEPELMQGIDQYRQALAARDTAAADAVYRKLPKIAIDYALLERAKSIIAVTGDYGWSDVGYWSTVHEIFGSRGDYMPAGHHLHVSSDGCYIYNTTNRAVTLIGLKDVIVVVTEDAVLVTSKDETHRIKEVVARLEETEKSDLL